MDKPKEKNIATNKKAKRNYQIFDTYETGIALRGDEVKSLRLGNCSITESFARIESGEVILYNMHIPEFTKSSYFKSQPKRPRKLLLHKKEISRLFGLTAQRGYTLVPLKIYFNKKGLAKVELALVKGRRLYDKRRKIKEKEERRQVRRQMRKYSQG